MCLAIFSLDKTIAILPDTVPISMALLYGPCFFAISIINSVSGRGIKVCLLIKKSYP